MKHPNQIASRDWATEHEVKRFYEWASYHVHGERDLPHQRFHPPLSLAEADSFLRELLKNWLRWKQTQQEGS
jgi:hypothetical protein